MLRNSASFRFGDSTFTDSVEQCRLSMIHMPHDRHNGGAWKLFGFFMANIFQDNGIVKPRFVVFHAVAKLARNELSRIRIQGLIHVCHNS
jgi:hypothetical protein